MFGEALRTATAIGYDGFRAGALGALVPQLPEPSALAQRGDANRRGDRRRPIRAEALGALAPHLPEALLGEALGHRLAIGDDWGRAYALSGLAPHLREKLQEEALSSLIQSAERLGRPSFLGHIRNFLAVIARLEGPVGIRELRRAVSETGRWFP